MTSKRQKKLIGGLEGIVNRQWTIDNEHGTVVLSYY